MRRMRTWDVSNLKAVQIDLDRFGKGKVVVNGVDISEEITGFALTTVTGSHVVLTARPVLPEPVEEVTVTPKGEPVKIDGDYSDTPGDTEVPETEVAPPEIPEPETEVELRETPEDGKTEGVQDE